MNTLGQSRKELVAFLSSSNAVRFHDLATGNELDVQVQPLLDEARGASSGSLQHLIQAQLPAAGAEETKALRTKEDLFTLSFL